MREHTILKTQRVENLEAMGQTWSEKRAGDFDLCHF